MDKKTINKIAKAIMEKYGVDEGTELLVEMLTEVNKPPVKLTEIQPPKQPIDDLSKIGSPLVSPSMPTPSAPYITWTSGNITLTNIKPEDLSCNEALYNTVSSVDSSVLASDTVYCVGK